MSKRFLTLRNIDTGNLNEYSLKNILLDYPDFKNYGKFEIGLKKYENKYEIKYLGDLIYEVLLAFPKPLHSKFIWKAILKNRGFPRYTIEQRLTDESKFIKVAPATYTVAENIDRYEDKSSIIIGFAKEWIQVKRNVISSFFICEVLKETAQIKDLSLGLVENVLSTSPEFNKIQNGFYGLANKD